MSDPDCAALMRNRRSVRRGAAVLTCVGGLALSVGSVAAQAGPGLTVSRTQAEAAFGGMLLFSCLTHVERGVAVADLSPEYRSGIVPAQGAEARLTVGRETATAVWTSTLLGSHLKLAEFGPAKCMITADQLPVEDTLNKAAQATERLDPPFVATPVTPGYWPVVHELERTAAAKHITIRLEGAEPGAPGHASRFSLLLATVTATPAS